ncbi:MAG: hypothetical protein HY981_00145 [Candidatus Magasanikbacteria bacterium]|nr:hypothetical protein [Candidatus Magasanikbacteria bacterium]
MRLLQEIVESVPHGLPLGNLTSQLFANVYMNIFDQWVKHSFLGILKHGHAQKIKQEVLGQYWLWKL